MMSRMMRRCAALCLLLAVSSIGYALAFTVNQCQVQPHGAGRHTSRGVQPALSMAHAVAEPEEEPVPFFLKPYQITSGEVVNPYQVLQVSRSASTSEIKRAFYKLSRRVHPDMMRHNNQGIRPEDARDEWERTKFAYEILKDRTSRVRYDRNEALADPGAALRDAALFIAAKSLESVGKGLFHVGMFALQQMGKAAIHVVEENIIKPSVVTSPMKEQAVVKEEKPAAKAAPLAWDLDFVPKILGDLEDRVRDDKWLDMGKEFLENAMPSFSFPAMEQAVVKEEKPAMPPLGWNLDVVPKILGDLEAKVRDDKWLDVGKEFLENTLPSFSLPSLDF